jgi:hypothetical protein
MSLRRLIRLIQRAPLGLLLGASLSSSGCAPLTFSNEPSIDFRRYDTVSVAVGGPDGSQRQLDYLEGELREHSGFRRVLRGDGLTEGPSAGGTAAQLQVELTLDSSIDFDIFSDDDEFDTDISYSASVRYQLSAGGAVVDSGVESVDDASSSFDAAEEALDLVVLHYLRPYRL